MLCFTPRAASPVALCSSPPRECSTVDPLCAALCDCTYSSTTMVMVP